MELPLKLPSQTFGTNGQTSDMVSPMALFRARNCHGHFSGYLVHIGNQQEQNCLLKFGHAEGYKAWYWTDGNILSRRTFKKIVFEAHEVDTPGVYIHGSDNNEVTWFSPKIISYAGDAIMLGIFTDANKGAWYEYPSTSKQLFICEAQV